MTTPKWKAFGKDGKAWDWREGYPTFVTLTVPMLQQDLTLSASENLDTGEVLILCDCGTWFPEPTSWHTCSGCGRDYRQPKRRRA